MKWRKRSMFLPVLLFLIGFLCLYLLSRWNLFSLLKGDSLKVFVRGFNDPIFSESFLFTFQYAFFATTIQLLLGFHGAYYVDTFKLGPLKTFFFLPLLLPPVGVAFIWRIMLNPDQGVFQRLLPIPLFSGSFPPYLLLFFIDIWIFTPFVMILLLAGLRRVSETTREMARIDGASGFLEIIYILLPALKPYLFIAFIFRFLDSLREFDVIYLLTQIDLLKRPLTFQLGAYRQYILSSDPGSSMLLLIFPLILSVLLVHFTIKRWW